MNKEKVFPVLLLSLVLLLLLVSVPFACAAGDNESQEEPETKDSPDLPIADDGVENVKGITKNASTAALDATKEGLFGIGANTSDASPILLPESVSNPIRIIFGISDNEPVPLDICVILVSMFCICVIVLTDFIDSFMRKKLLSFLIAVVISLILALSERLHKIALFFLGLFENSIENAKLIATIFVVAVTIILIVTFIRGFIKGAQKKYSLEEKERLGVRAGRVMRVFARRMQR